ncbi:MAG: TetR/AcrR family transcriptional regulator [Pseudomonadota bacterium]
MASPGKLSKRELTRARVIDAAIACIYEEGFHAAHTNRIAERAGASWGVLQYHFGDKDSLLQAVIDHIFAEFSASLAAEKIAGETLEERVGNLIDITWSQVSRREYRVSTAILRNAGKDPASTIDGTRQLSQWAQRTSELWDALFEPGSSGGKRSAVARRLLFAALRGMADEINPQQFDARLPELERSALVEIVAHLLSDPA